MREEFGVLLYAKNFFWVVVVHPPGISGSTYAMKLKLTPEMALYKRS